MTIVYNHYYDPNLPLRDYLFSVRGNDDNQTPPNCLRTAPEMQEGTWAGENNGVWVYFESHRGRQGYVNGDPFTVTEHGPLPEGWSDTPPPPTPEEEQAAQQQAFTNAIQQRLDDFARTRNYDNIMSAATYATSTVPKFQAEGQYAVEARDATWAKGYEIMNAVLAGERPMPTLEEVFAELPALEWPEVPA